MEHISLSSEQKKKYLILLQALVVRDNFRQFQKFVDQPREQRDSVHNSSRNTIMHAWFTEPLQSGHQNEVSDTGAGAACDPPARRVLQHLLQVLQVCGHNVVVERFTHRCGVSVRHVAKSVALCKCKLLQSATLHNEQNELYSDVYK